MASKLIMLTLILPFIKPLDDRVPLFLLHSNQVIWFCCSETVNIIHDNITIEHVRIMVIHLPYCV